MMPHTPMFVAVFALGALSVSAIRISDASGSAADSLVLAVREIDEPCKGQLLNAFQHVPDNSLDAETVNRVHVGSDGVISPDDSSSEEARDPLSMLTRACKASYLGNVGNAISAIEGVSLKYDYQDYGYGDYDYQLGATNDDEYYELGAASDEDRSDDGYYGFGQDAYAEGYYELGAGSDEDRSDDGYYGYGQDAYAEGYYELGAGSDEDRSDDGYYGYGQDAYDELGGMSSASGKASGSASAWSGKSSGSSSGKTSSPFGKTQGQSSGSSSPGKASGQASGSVSGFR